MANAACAKKLLCCNQNQSQSAAVDDTLTDWFDMAEKGQGPFAALVDSNEIPPCVQAVFDDIDQSSAIMRKSQKRLSAILEHWQQHQSLPQ